MDENRGGFWREHLWGIVRRGIEQGVFRRDIRAEAVVTALMDQFRGSGTTHYITRYYGARRLRLFHWGLPQITVRIGWACSSLYPRARNR